MNFIKTFENYKSLERFSLKEIKNDLIATWNEVEETLTSLNELTDDELIENKEALKERMKNALHWLGKYVSEDDIIETL
jgi:uncharacterized membrane-anchored protein YjiN (DUF445 family)